MSFTLPHQSRCIVAQLAEPDRPRFFAGTSSVFNGSGAENELRLLDFDEDTNEVSSQSFAHPSQIRSIAPAIDKADFVFTVSTEAKIGATPSASLFLLSALSTIDDKGEKLANAAGSLSLLLRIESSNSLKNISNVFWDPTGDKSRVIATGTNAVGVFAIDRALSKATLQSTYSIPSTASSDVLTESIDCGKWNPHNTDEFAFAAGHSLFGLDLRAPPTTSTFSIPYAHDQCIRDIDYNPNKPYYLATGGNDGRVRIWDSRNVTKPLKDLNNHTHWVWSVAYNKFHDQLLLSSSSDCLVNLHNVVSVSSTPFGLIRSMDSDEEGLDGIYSKTTDELIATYREFEDSVYSVAWSSADPWIFASVSFDGRVNINIVPKEVKYSIIL
ncbi:WD40 repeat-like protein [Rhizoclosmatium globosum]|uniref:WD40 repeat-like protein n=1 Tax=Rhizoclosmatium globosum TaxID=329046 RepID=A0A1Y2C593_9FUNG|nr:WD40 repeat-like protein [Rhizoclosmatium globosum]|eukprot:ORY42198.1 WD40 repeat-like protein [Rhizoclosmatium globosum]